MPSSTPTPLREALVGLVGAEHHLVGLVVLRQGLEFTLIRTFLADQAALLSSETALEQLSRVLELPVRLLDPANSAFLGAQLLLARRRGASSYSLKG